MKKYNQKEKKKARTRLLEHAIDSLTDNRKESFLIKMDFIEKSYKDYFADYIAYYLEDKSKEDINEFEEFIDIVLNEWKRNYSSITHLKSAEDLKILFLSGPEPHSDIQICLDKGIRRENIWAIEKDNKSYNSAVKQLIENRSYIKIHKGSLKDFLDKNDIIFDIVYLDACSPFISKSMNPLITLKDLFYNKRLSELSALITNFSELDDNIHDSYDVISAWYLTRDEVEYPEGMFNLFCDKILPDDLKSVSKNVKSNFEVIYGHFIRNFIGVISSEIIPMMKNLNASSKINKYYNINNVIKFYDSDLKAQKEIISFDEYLDDPIKCNRPQLF